MCSRGFLRGWSNANPRDSFRRVDVHAGADFDVLPRLREVQEPAMNLDRIPASIPLTDALICVDCDTILEAPATACPCCTNKELMSLAVWLDEPRKVG